MKDEKETREKLLASAKAEFSEKGFMKASLRNICKNAGVTTGALYFFFRDKDDLFVSLLKEPLAQIKGIMMEHYQEETDEAEKGKLLEHDSEMDIAAAGQLIHQMYRYREEMLLLLTKAQGSSLEHEIDEFVEIGEKHYKRLSDAVSKQLGQTEIEGNIIHWLAHMQVNIFIFMITHIETEQEAMSYMKCVAGYMVNGWFGMFGVDYSMIKNS